ncbi:MAG: Lrp/AsnC family transcriptional regulator [Nitrososphaerota archaeon]|nr:Lrp/AsnC family transcriptional regulator [Nitrososphaerota archaeon]MDG6922103.1 Lrp/AsnC family transcriptional regulator [Nitrososphaerota archaeon]
MDKLDVALLRELIQGGQSLVPFSQDIRQPYGPISDRLGVSEVTVRNRIAEIEKSGVIEGWSVALNPELIGLKLCRVRIALAPDSNLSRHRDEIDKIKLVEGVLELSEYFGGAIKIHIYYDTDEALKRRLELISKIAGSDDVICSRVRLPKPLSTRISEADLKILFELQGNPRRMLKSIAEDARVSTKTVARALYKLSNDGDVFLIPKFNPRALEGAVLADLLVTYSNPSAKADTDSKIMSVFGESMVVRKEISDPQCSYFQMILSNISSTADIQSLARQNPGVKSATLDLVQECFRNYEIIAEQISSQLGSRSEAFNHAVSKGVTAA